MVGGGPGAFIGEVHRKAAAMDGMIDLVAGTFASDPKKSRRMGRELGLDKKRVYNTYEDMIAGETALPDNERIDFVAITTPNNWHFPIAKAFWEAGFHIVCEKPMTMDVAEAKTLKTMVHRKRKQVFALMHNYTGYPMVKLARDMVAAGDIGDVRRIKVQYPQGWLADAVETTGQQQASWRTDPKQAGAAGCMGDIGTHAENLAEYITGLKMLEVCADLTTFVKGRKLDDDGNVLAHWQKGVRGVLTASQIAIGEENGLAIWIYGEKGGLEWHQEHPNYLYVKWPDSPVEIWRRGNDYIGAKSPAAARATRLPFGHPEAFFEAFANVYRNVAETILTLEENKKVDDIVKDFPTVNDGLRGMQFIDAVVKSSAKGATWVKLPK
jgi:predicted dehydrogenase